MSLQLREENPRPTRQPPQPFIALGAILVGVLVLLGFVVGARYLADRLNSDTTAAVTLARLPVTFEVVAGATADAIGTGLETSGVVNSAAEFANRARDRRVAAELKAGSYPLFTGMDVDEVLDLLVAGPDLGIVRLTVIEGLTISETLDSISASTGLWSAGELEAALLNGDVVSSLVPEGIEGLAAWEGMLFPDTYEFRVDADAAEVLQRLATTMELRVESVDWSRLEELGVTQYEAIVIASMIEEEVKLDPERPIVASVIYNRLNSGTLLQIDATVQYALPERKPALSLDDLQIDSPYNTYQNEGLPPTPISGVRLASLVGAASPAETPFFFYVLATQEGGHAFAETAEEFEILKAQAKENGLIP